MLKHFTQINFLYSTLIFCSCFKLFVLFFELTISSVETLLLLILLLVCLYKRWVSRLATIQVLSFILSLFAVSILVKFSLYFEENDFQYLLDTPMSFTECYLEFYFNYVHCVLGDVSVSNTSGDVIINDHSINNSVNTPVAEVNRPSFSDHIKNGDVKSTIGMGGEAILKVAGATVTLNSAAGLALKSKAAIKVVTVSAAATSALYASFGLSGK